MTDGRLEKVAYLSLLGFAAALQVSIAAANILLGLTALLWLVLVISRREAVEVPRFFWWLAAYAAWTLVAALFSIDPGTSFRDSKQLLLFAVVPIAYRLLRGDRSLVAIDVVISVAALSAAIGIVQFGILKWNTPDQRPQGALGMYMTYSGQLMLVACVAVARILFWPKERVWPLLVLPALIFALTVTLSRNAWVGAGAGIGLLLLFRDFRLLGILPVLLALLIALAPQHITERLTATFQTQSQAGGSDTTTATVQSNQDRIAMAKSGIRMIRDRPITGVGPDMVMELYPVYRDKTAVKQLAVHLHNVPLQIAAERGIPALLLWLGFLVVLVRGYFRRYAAPSWIFLSNAGLACVAAMIAAGMFEYNFGDSEFLMLFLLLVTLPYAAIRGEAART
jgi:putative inorganic carbon (HCO3(-)) transporter